MLALSIDTTANYCAAAVSDMRSGQTLAGISHDVVRGHAEQLMDVIDQCMLQANASYKDVERIISTIGPGSFSGTRAGLSTAQGIALSLSKPVIGISSLEACAQYALLSDNGKNTDRHICVILEARRNEVYFQSFQNGKPTGTPIISSIENLPENENVMHSRNGFLCGSGAIRYRTQALESGRWHDQKIIHHQSTVPIEIVASLGMVASVSESPPQILYLRPPDAKPQHAFAVPRLNP